MKFPDFSLNGKVALLTGVGSRGMAYAMALTFAKAGADVAVADIKGAEDIAREIRDMGRRSISVTVDISREADVNSMVDRVVRELGTIDILVNAAAVGLRKYLMDTTREDWDRLMDVNLRGYFFCCKAAARVMIEKKKGIIINMTSAGARTPIASTGAYSISKAGVDMMTKCLAVELIPHGIRVNAIGPGPVRTQFNPELWQDPEVRKEYESKLPFKRFAEIDEITGIALLLASEASSYMTGQTVYFDTRAIFNK